MIRFKCPCGRQLQAAESNAGQPARCPLCEQVTIVPFSDDASPPPGKVNEYGEIDRPEPKPEEPRPTYSLEEDRRPPARYDDRDRDRYDDRRPRYDDDYAGGSGRRRPAYDEDYDDRGGYRRRGYYGPQEVCKDANTALW